MQQAIPIPTLHLFPVLDKLLIELLGSLTPADWNKPTVARLWSVKDIAAHLLDTNMRTISYAQGYEMAIATQINSYQDLVAYLNELKLPG
ncbi:maleylpyruvate isomerase N-terminal domain-containing protein [Mucilaginibacter rigui]|uniref:Maleylpyruvate isomerase N-terminal domain-containing protein n=1 Tax=Mucilaginibacter rigui TaxID=534635 RepID=A0ABR7XB10_9SPHI|nr:maleylpyruvate isomerase N-terminal domain-containing protein [Mucilaginibacter rigui]MBD1387305.1 maleylpyruvate isomerase N-terminal domain-containing protein [Mucilaginibacter rigui]